MTHMSRFLYRCLVQLHPPAFRRQFAPEMLWIFDEIADHDARVELFTDAFTSLARQWVVRWAIQKLLIGELRFGSAARTGSGRFTWERIEFDDRPLPPPRVIQGGVVAFAFFTCIALAAFHANTVHRASLSGSGSGFSGLPACFRPSNIGWQRLRRPRAAHDLRRRCPERTAERSAPPDDGRPPRIPDTPAGHRFFEWLDAFDSGDKTKLEQFLKEHYPARAGAHAIDMEMQFRDQTGGFEFKDFDRDASSTTKFVGIVKERGSDQFRALRHRSRPCRRTSHHQPVAEHRPAPREIRCTSHDGAQRSRRVPRIVETGSRRRPLLRRRARRQKRHANLHVRLRHGRPRKENPQHAQHEIPHRLDEQNVHRHRRSATRASRQTQTHRSRSANISPTIRTKTSPPKSPSNNFFRTPAAPAISSVPNSTSIASNSKRSTTT